MIRITRFNNVKDARKAGWTDAIIPELNDLRDGWNSFLVPKEQRDTTRTSYDLSDVPELQEDAKEKSERLLNSYWLTFGEKRQRDDTDLDPNQPELMETYHIPANLLEFGSSPEEEETQRLLIEEEIKTIKAKLNGVT